MPTGTPKHGHEFSPSNTYIHSGRRQCRQCGNRAQHEYKARKRGAV